MRPGNPLGIAALVVAILAAAVQVAATPLALVLQVQGGAPFQAVAFGTAATVGVVALTGLVLAVVALRRPRSPIAACVAIGVSGYLLVGELGGAVAAVALSAA